MLHKFESAVAREFITSALGLIGRSNETVVRDNFTAHLPRIFPGSPSPWWVGYHVTGAERNLQFARGGDVVSGFVDNLVGLTVIEYEKNLSDRSLLIHGMEQVGEYCAGLINKGGDRGRIIGVLSDTLRWRAYRISSVTKPDGAVCGRDHIKLEEIDSLNRRR